MKLLLRLAAHIGSNILALIAAQRLFTDFTLSAHWKGLLIVGVLFGVLNMLIKPVLKLLFGPLIILTLGTFLIIINAIVLYLTDIVSDAIAIGSIRTLLLSTLVIGLVNFLLHMVTRGILGK